MIQCSPAVVIWTSHIHVVYDSSLGSTGDWWIPRAPDTCFQGTAFNDECLCSFPKSSPVSLKEKDCFWKWWFISATTFRNKASCQSDMSRQGIKPLFNFFFFFFTPTPPPPPPPCRWESNSFFKQVKVENQENSWVTLARSNGHWRFPLFACLVLGFPSNYLPSPSVLLPLCQLFSGGETAIEFKYCLIWVCKLDTYTASYNSKPTACIGVC